MKNKGSDFLLNSHMVDSYCNESVYMDSLSGIKQQRGSYYTKSGSVSRDLVGI